MKERLARIFQKPLALFRRFPLFSVIGVLAVLVALLIAGKAMGSNAAVEEEKAAAPKKVQVLASDAQGVQYVTVQAKVEKEGTVKVFAQSAGVVKKINLKEGEQVKKGAKVVELSSTYAGVSAPAIQRQLAQVQYDNTVATYDTQKSLISTQRQVVQASADNTEELRQINERSISDTTNVIDLNESLRNSLRESLEVLEQDPVANEARIAQTQASINQLESGLAQLNAGLRATQYQTTTDNPPTQLAQLSKEATLKQLEVQEKGLETAKQAAQLQLQLAQLQESLMMPTLAQSGVVERVYVQVGQSVTPGTALFSVSLDQKNDGVKVSGVVSKEIAQRILKTEGLVIGNDQDSIINNQTITNDQLSKISNYYVSTSSTDGVGYAVTGYGELKDVENGEYVEMRLPVGMQGDVRLVPVNVVYQTQDGAYVYVVGTNEQGKQMAQTRKVELGQVVGDFVEVESGLDGQVQVIVNRSVLEGDLVEVQ